MLLCTYNTISSYWISFISLYLLVPSNSSENQFLFSINSLKYCYFHLSAILFSFIIIFHIYVLYQHNTLLLPSQLFQSIIQMFLILFKHGFHFPIKFTAFACFTTLFIFTPLFLYSLIFHLFASKYLLYLFSSRW